jgi:hypothetical protein
MSTVPKSAPVAEISPPVKVGDLLDSFTQMKNLAEDYRGRWLSACTELEELRIERRRLYLLATYTCRNCEGLGFEREDGLKVECVPCKGAGRLEREEQ